MQDVGRVPIDTLQIIIIIIIIIIYYNTNNNDDNNKTDTYVHTYIHNPGFLDMIIKSIQEFLDHLLNEFDQAFIMAAKEVIYRLCIVYY